MENDLDLNEVYTPYVNIPEVRSSRFFDEKGKLHQRIQTLICTVALGIFNCFIDPLAKCLPANASNFLSRGLVVCSGSNVFAFGLGASTYFVSRIVLARLQNDTHSLFRCEVTDILVTSVVAAVFNVIAVAIFVEIQLVFFPTIVAGGVIGLTTYVVGKVFRKIVSSIPFKQKIENKNQKNDEISNKDEILENEISNEDEILENEISNDDEILEKEISNDDENPFKVTETPKNEKGSLYQKQISLWEELSYKETLKKYTINRLIEVDGKPCIAIDNEKFPTAVSFTEIQKDVLNDFNCVVYIPRKGIYKRNNVPNIQHYLSYISICEFAIEELKKM